MDDNQTEFELSEEFEAEVHGETKNEAFLRLVNKRLPTAVKRIRLLGNLSNTQNYDFTPEQAAAVCGVIRAELTKLEDAFSGDEADDIPTIG